MQINLTYQQFHYLHLSRLFSYIFVLRQQNFPFIFRCICSYCFAFHQISSFHCFISIFYQTSFFLFSSLFYSFFFFSLSFLFFSLFFSHFFCLFFYSANSIFTFPNKGSLHCIQIRRPGFGFSQ
ncbi:uncharacterized protein ASCRUDRAFT_129841 [Ascoidea rubescens DSM 1968]|uniref:Transmembrane protein n=1 Tax=Ascoidea rubescens DSM 1968 TaxID=1344418 RepID=A0A1D2V8Z6_9ASCO|nr:hypothetical protein ASCRUDRAFT_129841 [Ascoidea rubescens DSM 1968]ODV58114.1 hypothetical protein ASCRUDRAFT_129841 [Ascoidea rubescens DSM 1968]